MEKINCHNYKNKIYSQGGDDGILDIIFKTLKITNGTFVDFGGGDGILFSNSYNLIKNGWGGLLIEANTRKHNSCLNNMKGFKDVHCLNSKVTLEPGETIDEIVPNYSIFDNGIDFMSIDIDSHDYWIWLNMNKLTPKVITIETNSSNEWVREFYKEYATIEYNKNYNYHRPYFGASFNALVRLGHHKGYDFIARSNTNLFFIQSELNNNFEIIPTGNLTHNIYGTSIKESEYLREDYKELPQEIIVKEKKKTKIIINPPISI